MIDVSLPVRGSSIKDVRTEGGGGRPSGTVFGQGHADIRNASENRLENEKNRSKWAENRAKTAQNRSQIVGHFRLQRTLN